MKKLDIIRHGTPETLPIYHDSIQVTEDGNILFEGIFSSEPDPTRPPPHQDIKWTEFGARIAEGTYHGIVQQDAKHGMFIRLYTPDGGVEIPTLNPDINNGGRYIAKGVLVHTGYSDDWPGSIACMTIPRAGGKMFWNMFVLGEKVQIILRKVV